MNTKRFIEGRFEDCELSCIFLCQKAQQRIKIYKFEMEDDVYKIRKDKTAIVASRKKIRTLG